MGAALDIKLVEDWSSPKWRLNSGLYSIVDAQGNLIPFKMNNQQEEFFDNLWYWNLILKNRQAGFSTEIGLMALDQVMFTPTFRTGVIAQTMPDCTNLFRNKIEKPYLALPQDLRDRVGKVRSNATELVLGNGSSVKVGMSMRGDTLNMLHVSEFGKICRMFPERAREIVSGAFKTLGTEQILIVESTAEGEGQYKEYCDEAMARQAAGKKLTVKDFRLHFFPWWRKEANRMDPEGVEIDDNMQLYFDELETKHGVPRLDAAQKAWYAKESQILKGDMHREEPSYAEEAFKSHVKGAIYAKEMIWLRKNNRITNVPWQPQLPVNTFWDFGVSTNNQTCVWLHQQNGTAHCFIGYLEKEGEGLRYFVDQLKELGYSYGTHYLPHDGKARMQGELAETREEILNKLGLKNTEIVDRVTDIENGIELTADRMLTAYFDETNCDQGIKCLDNYVRKYDKQADKYIKPLHNWASNGSDAFRQWAQGYSATPKKTGPAKKKTANWKIA